LISEIDTISIIRYLEKDEVSRAKETILVFSPESEYEKGYFHALQGIISAYENKEADSIFYNLISDADTYEGEGDCCKMRALQTFRSAEDVGYEHAWGFILGYYGGSSKAGLDKYTK